MYILNLRSKTIHKYPTLEVCNVDSSKRKMKISKPSRLVDYKRWKKCKHCFS